jgi:uncharacterized membrane protein YphA (DoxX/SURF4 family)
VRGTTAVAWPQRIVVALAVLTSGLVHAWVWQDYMRRVDVVGPAFLVNAVAGVVIAVLLVVWRHPVPLLLAIGFGVATLGAFVVATSPLGLFGTHSRWEGWAEWTSAITEAIAIVVGLWGLAVERRRARDRW